MSELKTEAQLREEIIEEYSFDEADERVDKILKIKKDRFSATKAKNAKEEALDKMEKGKNHYKKLADPKGKKVKENDSSGDKTHNLSLKDQMAVLKSDIHVDDLEEVLEWAKSKHKGDVAKALGDNKLKAILDVNASDRKVADATNTSKTRKGASEVSIDRLKNDVKEGKTIEDDKDLDRFLEDRFNPKQ